MEQERAVLVSPIAEVPVVDGELVTAIRELADRGWGSKAIARELPAARNAVRRYRRGAVAGVQARPAARRLSERDRATAQELFQSAAESNAVVVQRLLTEQSCAASVRTVQRTVAPVRQVQRTADVIVLSLDRCVRHQREALGLARVCEAGPRGYALQPQLRSTHVEWHPPAFIPQLIAKFGEKNSDSLAIRLRLRGVGQPRVELDEAGHRWSIANR